MTDTILIDGRPIGPDHPPYIVAELSANHNGTIDRAFQIMEAAKEAGADAVKLQTYTADTMTIASERPEFEVKGGPWDGYTLHRLYEEAHTPWEWHEALFAKGRELGLTVFSTPFDVTAVDFLEDLGNPVYKIASFEAVDLELIGRAAATGKPMIMSTGMADLGEIAAAVDAAAAAPGLVLLHCVSAYPAPAADANLLTIPHLAQAFGTMTGLSDHTLSNATSVAAVALGAVMIEKHFTLRRSDGGPDGSFSLEPDELAALCRDCRTAWEARGSVNYRREPSERSSMIFRRSLFVVADVAAGEPLTRDNVRCIRPGYGLAPSHLPDVLGRRAARDVARGTPLSWDLLS